MITSHIYIPASSESISFINSIHSQLDHIGVKSEIVSVSSNDVVYFFYNPHPGEHFSLTIANKLLLSADSDKKIDLAKLILSSIILDISNLEIIETEKIFPFNRKRPRCWSLRLYNRKGKRMNWKAFWEGFRDGYFISLKFSTFFILGMIVGKYLL